MKNVIIIIFFLLLAPAICARGAELLVPSQYPTIQAAINAAIDDDTVIIAPGTYSGSGNRDIDFLGKAITIRSETGPENCIIDCQGTEGERHRGFYFHSNENANSVISGLTIINGYGPLIPGLYDDISVAGGIYCYNSSPTIDNCIIRSNQAISDFLFPRFDGGHGGGMYNKDSNPTLTNCIFSDNIAFKYGGGIYNDSSCPTIINCTFNNNSLTWNHGVDGGGMYNNSSSPTLSNCIFNGNSAHLNGGGMYNLDSNPTLTNCTFQGNAAGSGGGMCNKNSSPILENCAFENNWAESNSGGMNNSSGNPILTGCIFRRNQVKWYNGGGMTSGSGNPKLTNCIFYNNSAGRNGGGISNYSDGEPALINCTFIGNSARDYGGALNCGSFTDAILINCILWGNTAAEGPEISITDWSGENQAMLSTSYCDVRGGKEAVYVAPTGVLYWGEMNIDADPCFVDVDANDYHLKSEGWSWDTKRSCWTYDDVTSRCIDAGNPGSPLGDELLSVPDDPNNEWGENLRINMGAFGGTAEASIPPYDWALLSDVTNDGISDLSDLDILSSLWLDAGDQLYADFNRDGIIDLFDFALLAQDWLKQTTWYE